MALLPSPADRAIWASHAQFGTFFGITPQGLVDEGIYKEVAIALHSPPHRSVSLALLAQALGATKALARSTSMASISLQMSTMGRGSGLDNTLAAMRIQASLPAPQTTPDHLRPDPSHTVPTRVCAGGLPGHGDTQAAGISFVKPIYFLCELN